MFNLLNVAKLSIDSLLLNIFIILAVVIAGALIVYFLWEIVTAIATRTYKSVEEEELVFEEQKSEANGVSNFVLDQETKTEQVEENLEENVVFDESQTVAVDEDAADAEQVQAQAEADEEERQNAERRAYLEARRQELLRRMQEESEEEQTEDVEESADEENVVEEEQESEEADETEVEESEEVETEEVVDETEETVEDDEVDALEEERRALEEEKSKYENMVRELEAAKIALAEQQAQVREVEPVKVVETVVVNNSSLSLDELKEKLANAEQRLKATEKEFKQCKKEFIPLHKVWSTHEKDEKKLRRKEALVAKQKVLLYGVNNYADIDEDKAKKLAEDLDLLDGLKLSVQHCEEVMKNNEERYPLLEKMYNVLKSRNDELKNDIAVYTAEIERLEAEQATEEQSSEE